jgi:hypothetical protein
MLRSIMLTTSQVIFASIISMVLFPPEQAIPLLTVSASWFLAGYFTRGFWVLGHGQTPAS